MSGADPIAERTLPEDPRDLYWEGHDSRVI